MKTLATCTNTLPKTCLDTSKNQILTGRCGRSRQRLYTSDISARPPRASCTRMAKEPIRRHSVGFESEGEPVAVARAGSESAGVAEGVMMMAIASSLLSISVSVAGTAWRAAAGGDDEGSVSSGSIFSTRPTSGGRLR